MQNRYVGDVGDFGKYGLLRFLTGAVNRGDREPDPSLGVVWYLVPDEVGGDGQHTGYLERTPEKLARFHACDPDLWGELHRLVRHERNGRCVRQVERAAIWPENAVFYRPMLVFGTHIPMQMRPELRRLWLAGARVRVAATDLVFLDPDNNLADPRKMFLQDGPKYTYLDDLREFWNCGKSLVVYHHLGMGEPACDQIDRVAAQIRDGLEGNPEVLALRFHRGTARVFFVVAQDNPMGQIVRERAEEFLGTEWGEQGHFTGP